MNCGILTMDNFIFDCPLDNCMADAVFMFGVTAGIFAFLVAILFVSRGVRKRRGPDEEVAETHSSGSSPKDAKKIRKFKSDGTPA
jgi:hypothetical protein